MSEFSKEGKDQVKQWLLDASQAAEHFDGSEGSEDKLFEPLSLFDDFIRAHDDDSMGSEREQKVAEISFPDHPINMPLTVDGFLDVASEFYDRLKDAGTSQDTPDVWATLENAGAVIKQSDQVFVKTDEGQLQEGQSDNPTAYEVKTEPRLAMLIAHLRNDGVNGQSVYMDDLVIVQGRVDADMMREHPYNIVQIPRLDIEISVCDQVGETTFIKKGTVGSEFWDQLSKDQLKERDDVAHVDHHNYDQWWREISEFLTGNSDINAKKVNVQRWNNRAPKLDLELVKQSLLAHRQETGEWLSSGKKSENKRYVLEYGAYAGLINVKALDSALTRGQRGLVGGSSVTKLNIEISDEHNVDYNKRNDLDILLIKESLLAHRMETGEWLSNSKKSANKGDKRYVLEHGSYAGYITVTALDSALSQGLRSLVAGSSVAKLNEEISDEKGLDYINVLEQEDLTVDFIKESLLAHYLETDEWLSVGKRGEDGTVGSYTLQYGHYAGMPVSTLQSALYNGTRGLLGGSSIAKLNAEISNEYRLDYINVHEQDDLDIELIKQSLLEYRQETGTWLTKKTKGADGKGYVLEHGPYAGKLRNTTLESNLGRGERGLSGGSSIFKLNKELKAEMENPVLGGVGVDEEEIDNSPSVE